MKHQNPAVFRGAVAVRAEMSLQAQIQSLAEAFSAFREGMDDKAKAAATGAVDVLIENKIAAAQETVIAQQTALERLQAIVDTQAEKIENLNAAQAAGAPVNALSENERKHISAMTEYFRTGDEGELNALHKTYSPAEGVAIKAALSVGSNPDGGYTAPIEWDRTVTDALVEISEMRMYASVQTVDGQGFTKLYNAKGTAGMSGWVGETDARPETATPQLTPYSFSFGEIYANPAMSQRSLEDPELDLAAWLAGEVEEEFALQEGNAFLSGDGVNKPKGVLMYDATAEGALAAALRHPLGPIGEVPSGAVGALSRNGLINLTRGLKPARRNGASFYMNDTTMGEVMKLDDGQGNLLWQPSFQAGTPGQMLGYGTRTLTGMPDIATGNIAVMFGNMERTYRIFDRVGMSVLRDPYTNKPYVHFYTRKRVGGGLWNPEWMKYHRIG